MHRLPPAARRPLSATVRAFAACALSLVPLTARPAVAADAEKAKENAVDRPDALTVEPVKFALLGSRSRQQLLVTGAYPENEKRDLTRSVTFAVSNPAVLKIVGTMAHPVGNGTAQITATVAGKSATFDVEVKHVDAPRPISFGNETLAALTKAGCNMGACHGSPSGKGGFRLSLRGYDPPLDVVTLRTEFFGRRTSVMNPDESLLLKKPLMEVAHGGGRRLTKGDPAHRVLREWIAEGLPLDRADEPQLLRLQVLPEKRVLSPASRRQQIVALGHFSDGTIRDLTDLTVFSSSNEAVATVNEAGLVDKLTRGETAVLARYLDKMATSEITFLENVPGFVWNDPRPNNFVDELVFEKLKQLQILPSDLCTDEEFVRRAYLDVAGRLPSIAESQAYLGDASSDRRDKLIDRLLESPDYAGYWTLKWSDVLRANSKKLSATGVHKFRQWIYEGIRADKPLDDLARELLTAQGSVFENPAAAYWKASRDPLDATETTAQLFLGIRIQCAKCHNHPFERWSQDNYYGIAAAFTRVGRKVTDDKDEEVIFVAPAGEVQQPRTGKTMKVHLLLSGDVDVPAESDRRRVFADWLVAGNNPFFAKACVNRIWGHLLGRGIVEPVDDFRDSNPPSNAKLLDSLAKGFVENRFSHKWAIRTIMQSRVYQLSSRKNDFNQDDEIYGSHAQTRLLTAEQLLDSISDVTSVAESFKGLPPGTRATELPDPPTDHYFLKIFGQPQREMACQCERSSESNLSQALQMINGPVVHDKLRSDAGRIAKGLAAGRTDEEIVRELYQAGLCRQPSADELAAAAKHVETASAAAPNEPAPRAAARRQALEDVGWAILNSKEFLFQH